jgi:tripartite-type tricarboxylate transporter receptor subunit TctC
MSRARRFVLASAAALTAALAGPAALGQGYPAKPVRLLVPFAPGGGTDFFARSVGGKMSEALGQQIMVENRPGASSIIAAEVAAKSAPDGYTMLLGDTTTYAVNPSLFRKLPYDPQKDFAPVSLTARFVMTLAVNPAVVNAGTVQDLVGAAKKQPGKIDYATPGPGTPHHLAMELFQQRTGTKLTQVPYKGAAPAIQDMLGGQIGLMFLDLPSATPHLKSGKIKVIATATPKPVAILPGVPTIAASGVPGFEAWAWQGFVVPAGTPPDAITKLHDAYVKAVNDPGVRAKLVEAGIEPLQSTAAEMGAYMKAEREKWATWPTRKRASPGSRRTPTRSPPKAIRTRASSSATTA